MDAGTAKDYIEDLLTEIQRLVKKLDEAEEEISRLRRVVRNG
jgi:Mg2+ and Co2+ transporter CorA